MGRLSYQQKLNDPRWQTRRMEILERDEFECRRCYNPENILQVHHLKYQKNKEPWEYADDDLLSLCNFCHPVVGTKQTKAEIENPWLIYEREKKSVPEDLYPEGYADAILKISNRLSL